MPAPSDGAGRELWRTRTNRFKRLLRDGKPATAYFATIPWPPSLEIAGACGMDAAIIDLEHSAIGLVTLEHLMTAAQGRGMAALVRPPGMDTALISRILDSGADGILFPHVETVEHAVTAARSMRYPPSGTRGWGGAHTRAALWQGRSVLDGGLPEERGVYSQEYIDRTEGELSFGLLIESQPGVDALDAILDAAAPDFVMFGRGDFSAEVRFDSAACDAAFATVYAAARRRGIGLSLAPGQAAKFYPGCFATVGLDALWLSAAVEAAVRNGRAALDRHDRI
jgi:4-hydroxy-2-oxoheptanedioate aldolase